MSTSFIRIVWTYFRKYFAGLISFIGGAGNEIIHKSIVFLSGSAYEWGKRSFFMWPRVGGRNDKNYTLRKNLLIVLLKL